MPATLSPPAQAKKTQFIPTKEWPKDNPGRIFKTVRGQVGPFKHIPARVGNGTNANPQFPAQAHVFSEAEFARLHPIPDSDATRGMIDLDTYHPDLLKRLILIGEIVEAPGETPMDTPGNPDGNRKNPGILESAESVLSNRKTVERQKSEDLARLTAAQK